METWLMVQGAQVVREVLGLEVLGLEVLGSEALGSEALGSQALGSQALGLGLMAQLLFLVKEQQLHIGTVHRSSPRHTRRRNQAPRLDMCLHSSIR